MSAPRPLFPPARITIGGGPDPLDAPLTEVANQLAGPSLAPPPDDDLADDEQSFAARVGAVRSGKGLTRDEGSIVAEILDWLRVQPGVRARKVHGSMFTGGGEPDLDICWHGRTVKIEVKRPGERLRPDQLHRLLWWQEAGALVGWVTSVADLRAILAHVDRSEWRQSSEQLAEPGA